MRELGELGELGIREGQVKHGRRYPFGGHPRTLDVRARSTSRRTSPAEGIGAVIHDYGCKSLEV